MATTTLFVEIIIIGLETLACLVGLIGLVTPFAPPSLAAAKEWNSIIKEWAALITLLVVTTAYILGILMDRFADDTYTGLRKLFEATGITTRERLPAAPALMRLTILKESEGISKFLDYQRSRLRIARATVFNLIVGLPIGVLYLIRARSTGWVAATVVVGVLVIMAVIYATEGINAAYEKRLSEAYLMLRTATTRNAVVAAVCYRRSPGGIQILLVKTKGGRYWTFPKGHVKKKERDRPWKAAEREAREEAGVEGTVRERPLGVYRYPSKPRKGIDLAEDRVTAFLFEVADEGRPHERRRKPTWFDPGEAKAKLAEGDREATYATEQQRVIDLALAILG